MLLTESEAKTKWCPFARLPHGLNRVGGASLDDGPMIAASVCCIASQCMAWRWDGYRHDNGVFSAQTEKHQERVGHCGLAGKVEP